MLGGLALKWQWRKRRQRGRQAGRPAEPRLRARAGLLGEVRALLRRRAAPDSDSGRRDRHDARPARAYCDENTIGVVPTLGITFTGAYEPVAEIAAALDALRGEDAASTSRFTSTPPAAASSPRSSSPISSGTSGCPASSRSTPPGTSTGWRRSASAGSIWRDTADLPEELIFRVDYLGGDMPTFALNFSRPGGEIIAQYYNFIRLGRDGYRAHPAGVRRHRAVPRRRGRGDGAVHAALRRQRRPAGDRLHAERSGRRGLLALRSLRSACACAAGRSRRIRCRPIASDTVVQRILVRHGVSRDMASLLAADIRRALDHFKAHPVPRTAEHRAGFHH